MGDNFWSYTVVFNVRWLLSRFMAVCAFAFLAGCRDNVVQPGRTPVALEITAPAFFVYSGGTLQLSAIARFADETTGDVTREAVWTNFPGHAGRVKEGGLFVATLDSTGIETVRADYQGQTDSVDIEVTKGARSLVIWPVSLTIASGGKVQFAAIAEFHDASMEYVTDKVSWSVSPGVAATIDSSGLFRSKVGLNGLEIVTGMFQALSAQSRVRVQETLDNPFEMVMIPGGSFVMGDDDSEWPNEKPAHEVTIDAFEIGKYEVTNEQYVTYLNEALVAGEIMVESGIVTGRKGPFAWRTYLKLLGVPEFPDRFIEYVEVEPGAFVFRVKPGFEEYPVVRLNWYGAAAFCSFYGLRLPTEAEWEKACRGGQHLEYGTQDGSISHDLANYAGVGGDDVFNGLAPAGSFPPNPYGLYDMSGNAAEYVFDQYDENYYANSSTENPTGPGSALLTEISPTDRAVWRGGSGLIAGQFCRSAFRGYIEYMENTSLWSTCFVGFRVARSLP